MRATERKETKVEITDLQLNGAEHDGIQGATCHVKGITKQNYDDNRVFFVNGERWVLQYTFGYDCQNGTKMFWAERRGQ
jgi:hypothetical protein